MLYLKMIDESYFYNKCQRTVGYRESKSISDSDNEPGQVCLRADNSTSKVTIEDT